MTAGVHNIPLLQSTATHNTFLYQKLQTQWKQFEQESLTGAPYLYHLLGLRFAEPLNSLSCNWRK